MWVKKNKNTEKNGFVTATKLGTTNEFFVASTKNFAAATKRFVDRTKHFVVETKYFCYPYLNKSLCWHNKTFFFREERHFYGTVQGVPQRWYLNGFGANFGFSAATRKIIEGSFYDVDSFGGCTRNASSCTLLLGKNINLSESIKLKTCHITSHAFVFHSARRKKEQQ